MDEARSRQRLDDEEVTLLDYWRVVRRRLRLIVILCVVAVLVTLGISLCDAEDLSIVGDGPGADGGEWRRIWGWPPL